MSERLRHSGRRARGAVHPLVAPLVAAGRWPHVRPRVLAVGLLRTPGALHIQPGLPRLCRHLARGEQWCLAGVEPPARGLHPLSQGPSGGVVVFPAPTAQIGAPKSEHPPTPLPLTAQRVLTGALTRLQWVPSQSHRGLRLSWDPTTLVCIKPTL